MNAKEAYGFAEKKSEFFGVTESTFDFLIKNHFCDRELWAKFVDEYRIRRDGQTNAWRGEFWGKMMRGACLIYAEHPDDTLFEVLTETVRDMLTVVGEDGRVSTYTVDTEFNAWDMWCRKYVMLGLEYYLDICRDEALKSEIISFLRVVADYICLHVGEGEGKIRIVDTSKTWHGINSSSILEPVVRLYKLTNDEKYLDFASYIVKEGAAKGINVFEMAYENKLYPYQYGANKAYELISCFEGLVEYYKVTGIEKYKTAAVNFGKGLLATDYTVIGTAGITHELLDHSTTRQTVRFDGVSQETCVTVTMMKYFSLLHRLTGESAFADAIEKSYYNAYLGALNTEYKVCPYGVQKFGSRIKSVALPFDSYSPLLPGKRGVKIGGSQDLMGDIYYGCCACIAGAGIGIYAKTALLSSDDRLVLNFLERGEHSVRLGESTVKISVSTEYPADGLVNIAVSADTAASFCLSVRIPEWAKSRKISTELGYTEADGYAHFSVNTEKPCLISVLFDMPIVATYPVDWDEDVYIHAKYMAGESRFERVSVTQQPEEREYVSFSRGPITLAADSSLGRSADSVVLPKVADGIACGERIDADRECIVMCELADRSADSFRLIDYASAGRDWETMIAAWIPTKR